MKTFLLPANRLPWYFGLPLLLLFLAVTQTEASHIRAGEITAMRDTTANPNPRRIFFKMTIYTNRDSAGEEPTVTIYIGDGLTITVPRKSVRQVSPDIDQEVYTWQHTYPGAGTYNISWHSLNRNNGILNMAAPSNQQNFYISTTININAFRGLNSTPQFKNIPTFFANVGSRFVYNPGAFDPEGDSLSFRFVPPRSFSKTTNQVTLVPGYSLPGSVFNCQNAAGTGAGTFTMDPATGQITWDAPCLQGQYTVAYVVEEWRVTQAGAVKVGEVVHDMYITVRDVQNRPPALTPKDTCIVAGTTLNAVIRATDPDGDLIRLSAAGGIFPSATFTPRAGNATSAGVALGDFNWTPACQDVRSQPYQVIFRAEDTKDPANASLADMQPWNIRVIAPPPQQPGVSRQGNNLQLEWGSYACQGAATLRIYRRQGTGTFVPADCQTNVPASSGYTLVGQLSKDATTFLDTNNGLGLPSSNQYCYVIVAVFPTPGNGRSIASAEVCASPGPLSLKDALHQSVHLYPNPAQGRLQITLPANSSWSSLRLYTITGMLLLEVPGNGKDNFNLELPPTATGLHLLQLHTKAGLVTKRVLLE